MPVSCDIAICCSARSLGLRRRSLCSNLPLLATLFLLSVSFITPCSATSPTSDDCLACHSDKTMTTKRGGRTVSLFVDQKKFAGSIHGSLQCTSCHADLEGKDLPHSTPLAKVNCGSCHGDEAQQYAKSLHGKAADRGSQLCLVPHGALHPAPYGSQLVHRPAQYCRHLYQVPRQYRTGAPQDHSWGALGKTSQHSSRLRRLPPAAQSAQRFLLPGDGRCRLHALPRQCQPQVRGWPFHAGARR